MSDRYEKIVCTLTMNLCSFVKFSNSTSTACRHASANNREREKN